ncbi:MAG: fluoride efflux transporter CrcB [Acidobacteria bacterium]|nr:fluoride efflux transporter CrcB [Acidobacteriota bacterium]
MERVLWVGLGGFIGSVARYGLSGTVQKWYAREDFPLGTLVVNCLGCMTIGFLSELAEARGALSAEARAFLFIGVLGGFTTFSSFGNETMNLLRDSERALAWLNVASHLFLGLGAVWLGRVLGHAIGR